MGNPSFLLSRVMADKNNVQESKWLSVGIAIGLAIGVAMDNIALGICIGVALGVSFGHYERNKNKKEK